MNKKHQWFYSFFHPIVRLYIKCYFDYTYEPVDSPDEPYIVFSNHITDWDPLFVGMSFKKQMYFVASEHIARSKLAYAFLKFVFAPIMRYKGALAAATVKDIFKTIKRGDSVCIFAEGVRTRDGITAPILPSTGKMVKSARCGLITYKLTGGYFASPVWSEGPFRRGPIHGSMVNIYTKEQLAEMSVDEINAVISNDLYEDAYATQAANPQKYKGKRLAEHLENLLFICPECKRLDTMSSHENTVCCSHCGHHFTYNEYGSLDGCSYTTIRDLAAWQQREVEQLALTDTIFSSSFGTIKSIHNHEETLLSEGNITMNRHALVCGNVSIPTEEILDMAIYGKRNLVFSTQDNYYELLPEPGGNGIKYLLLYEAVKKQKKG